MSRPRTSTPDRKTPEGRNAYMRAWTAKNGASARAKSAERAKAYRAARKVALATGEPPKRWEDWKPTPLTERLLAGGGN